MYLAQNSAFWDVFVLLQIVLSSDRVIEVPPLCKVTFRERVHPCGVTELAKTSLFHGLTLKVPEDLGTSHWPSQFPQSLVHPRGSR